MTTGQMVFYAGIGLLGLTIILAIIFLIKKPKYIPSKATYDVPKGTQKLRNGYPTDRLTIRREEPVKPVSETVKLPKKTVKLSDNETVRLEQETVPLSEETMPLQSEATVSLQNGTIPLEEKTTGLADHTEKL